MGSEISVQPGGRILVTGASGFVGSAVVASLCGAGFKVRGSGRSVQVPPWLPSAVEWVRVAELSATTDWSEALEHVDAVVHLAARVHQLQERGGYDRRAYFQVNTDGTLRLAESAVAADVRRFLFISTVKVHGELSGYRDDDGGKRFSEHDDPCPSDAYAQSKWEAERRLAALGDGTQFAVTVLRPPLVYGPGVGANFALLLAAVARGVPLPFKNVNNLRSLVYLENLVDAIRVCLQSSTAVNRTFLVSDVDVSTPGLIRAIAAAMGRSPRLVPVPVAVLRLAGTVLRRTNAMSRLLDSLVVDNSSIRSELNWNPQFALQDGLARTVRWFNATSR